MKAPPTGERMKERLRLLGLAAVNMLIVGYPLTLILLRGARSFWGDGFWWLAIVNTFAPWSFAPAPLTLTLGVLTRRDRKAIALTTLPVLIFALVYGPKLFRFPHGFEAQSTISVMTYNIYGFNQEVEGVLEVIRSVDPDVIAFQELNPEVARELESEMSALYPYQVLDPQQGVTGLGVVSKLPLVDQGYPDLASWSGWLQQVAVEWQGQWVTVLNAHALPIGVGGRTTQERFSSIQKSYLVQETQTRDLLAYTAELPGPIVVAGDFNRGDENATAKMMNRAFLDAYAEVGAGFGHTFPMPGQGWAYGLPLGVRLTVRLDYIYYSPDLRTVFAQVAPWDGGSDHLAVVAVLEDGRPMASQKTP